ncbi:hypothetical protein GCM10009530_18290 [Microbispora corallina]|uniref:helix-turn-helix domain-containing protein n=1 Tax=Microbispora corallina TaxID=83302 RepID=UPI0031D3E58B
MAGSGADKEFARRLRGLKERSGRSYEELARSAFVSSSTLHRYCSGRSVPPDIGVVVRVAKECGAGSQELQELLRAWAAAEAERRPADGRAAAPASSAAAAAGDSGAAGTATAGDSGTATAATGSAGAEEMRTVAPPAAGAPSPPGSATPGETGPLAAEPGARPAKGADPPTAGAAVHGTRGGPSWAALRGRRGVRRLALLAALLAVLVWATAGATTSRSPAADRGRRAPQWISGPSWERDPAPVDPRMFGVTINSNTGDMPAFQVGAVRFWDSGTQWAEVEPRRGEYSWTTLDRLVAGAGRAGLPAMYVFGAPPSWAAPTAPLGPYDDMARAAAPDDLDDWDDFVRAVVTRYRGRIEAYELWVLANDPRFYNGRVETLVEMARRASGVIRATDPRALVVCPGMGRLWNPSAVEVMRRFAAAGGYRYCDAAGVKLYQRRASDPPETMLDVLRVADRTLHEAGVHPPLWNTGTTYDIPLQGSLDDQAAVEHAVRFYLVGLYGTDDNLRRMYFYNWGGTKIPVVLQAVGGAPTRAALAVERLQRWLSHARLRACGRGLAIGLPDNVWQCAFLLDGPGGTRPAVVRWTHAGTADTVAPSGASGVERLDGTRTPVRPGDTVRVTGEPVLIG